MYYPMGKVAFITGITGQDGSYLAEFLLSMGYRVHGMVRRSSSSNTGRIDHIVDPRICLHYGDMTDGERISNLINTIRPDEVYNLAAQSHVGVSFDTPEYTGNVDGLGTARLLQAIYQDPYSNDCEPIKFYQASTSELFGNGYNVQSENTPMSPRSPYACAKLYAYWMTKNYRDRGMYTVNGILFNHESPRRGIGFVTRKITKSIALILAGKMDHMTLGNLDAKRDWGYAPEYVELMWKMMQEPTPRDYVLGTGRATSIYEFLTGALEYAGLDNNVVTTSAENKRPIDVNNLCAENWQTRTTFGWSPRVYADELAKIMIDADMRAEGLEPIGEGDAIITKTFKDKWWSGD